MHQLPVIWAIQLIGEHSTGNFNLLGILRLDIEIFGESLLSSCILIYLLVKVRIKYNIG